MTLTQTPKWMHSFPARTLLTVGVWVVSVLSCGADQVGSDWAHESRKLLRSWDSGAVAVEADAQKVSAWQAEAFALLNRPVTGDSWQRAVENCARLSFHRSGGSDVQEARRSLDNWLSALETSRAGTRAERATISARLLREFTRAWGSESIMEVRDTLNQYSEGVGTLAPAKERHALRLVEAVERARLWEAASSGAVDLDPQVASKEYWKILEGDLPGEIRGSLLARCLRMQVSTGLVGMLDDSVPTDWVELVRDDHCADTLSAAFFLYWEGFGDRDYAFRLLKLSDEMVSDGRIPEQSPEIHAMQHSYYRGLLRSFDQMVVEREEEHGRISKR